MAGGFATSGFAAKPFTFIKSVLAPSETSGFPGALVKFGLKKPFFPPTRARALTFD
jgi:hypothetical protein